MKKVGIISTMVLIILMVFTSCTSESGSEIGDSAYDFEVEDSDGNLVKLSDFEGKTVFVLAWSTT